VTATSSTTSSALNLRERSVLRAVEAGRCQVVGSGSVLLLVDGVGCSDQFLGARLVRAGLVAPPGPDVSTALLTPSGRALLAAA
jgi:hypothetical protein